MRLCACLLLLLVAWAASADAGNVFDPAHRYRTVATEHFVIYFHQGEDAAAARMAGVAEDVWRRLSMSLGTTPPPRIHLVLTDESEAANGWATPLPYDTVVVTATRPAGSEFIGNTDDWFRLVLTHELTHIAQIDQSTGWARVVRRLFGRTPVAFPNLFLPRWQLEGLATYQESARTGDGRLRAGDFRAIENEMAAARRGMPLDRVNGGLSAWPSGLTEYVYGLGFHAYLADKYGDAAVGTLANATAGRLPYATAPVFRRIFGRPLGDLWRDYQARLAANAAAAPSPAQTSIVRVTHHGFTVLGPRFARNCDTCPPEILYSLRTPHAFPTLNAVALDGGASRSLTKRYLGSTTAVGPEIVYFDQVERRRNAGLYADLYALDRRSGRVRRLTSEARLLDPDVSSDGRTLAAVRSAAGRRDLVLLPLSADGAVGETTLLASASETHFAAPRWSPNGRTLVVERQRLGARAEIVTVDVADGTIRVVASAPETRFVTPTWRPDGLAIIAAVAQNDRPFNLVELDPRKPADAQSPCYLTQTTGGATWPDVSPDGTRIAFVGQTADGFDVFQMPYPRASCSQPPMASPESRPPQRAFVLQMPTPRPYTPWPTLRPTSWSPIVSGDSNLLRLGAGIAGVDVLGYHSYAASASWLATSPVSGPGTPTLDWAITYAYSRWRPTFWAALSADTSVLPGSTSASAPSSDFMRQEHEYAVGMLLPVAHVRTTQTVLGSIVRATTADTPSQGPNSRDHVALRAAWMINSSHLFGYSIAPERGVSAGGTLELARQAFGASADATSVTGDARAYLPAFSIHDQLALRVAAGLTSGDSAVGRLFTLGGSASSERPFDFGSGALGLLRGFPVGTFVGTRLALLNAEYRFPLVRPERGLGTLPVFLHTMHAAVFADAGHAWRGAFDRRDMKTSVGAELAANLVAGYSLPVTVAIGAAWGRDGSGLVPGGGSVYARVGRAF